MKAKLPILIAASLFLTSVLKAQYGAPCTDNRVVIQGQFAIPGTSVVAFNYNRSRDYYPDQHERRNNDYGRYDDKRDWRAAEYDRYCHENRGYRLSREEFYRTRCDIRFRPYYAPQKVVVYRY